MPSMMARATANGGRQRSAETRGAGVLPHPGRLADKVGERTEDAMDAQVVLNNVWEPLCRAARGWLDAEAELDRFAARMERVLARRPGAGHAAGDQAADDETIATPLVPMPSQQTMLADAAAAAMTALPEVPAQTQLPFAELIYPKPGARHASTLVYRAGERVFKIALDADAAARLAREARFLSGPLSGYACFADVYRLGSVRDARLSAEPLACLSEQYIAGLPADAWVLRHAQGLEPGSVARERIVGALYDRLLEALAIVHRAGIIHRDIHPGNILVDEAGAVHLIDFGCAITLAEADVAARDPALRECVLSRGFEAPEAHVGGPYTPKTDLYAAGAVAAQLAFGTRDVTELPPTPLGRRLARVLG